MVSTARKPGVSTLVQRAAALSAAAVGVVAPAWGESLADVEIEANGCPSSELVRAQLEPLMAPPARRRHVRVTDLGESYRVETGTTQRDVLDPRRDCLERARVAAVFIALNLNEAEGSADVSPSHEQQTAPLPKPSEASVEAPPRPSVPPEPRSPSGVRYGAHAFGRFEAAPGPNALTGGAGLGFWASQERWRIALGGAGLAPVDLQADEGRAPDGNVELTRLPVSATVARIGQLGSIELSPFAGAVLDLLLLEGQGYDETRASARANVGMCLGVSADWLLSRRSTWFAELQIAAYPRAYRLVVEPTGIVSYTPRWWLGLSIGARMALEH